MIGRPGARVLLRVGVEWKTVFGTVSTPLLCTGVKIVQRLVPPQKQVNAMTNHVQVRRHTACYHWNCASNTRGNLILFFYFCKKFTLLLPPISNNKMNHEIDKRKMFDWKFLQLRKILKLWQYEWSSWFLLTQLVRALYRDWCSFRFLTRKGLNGVHNRNHHS